MKKSWEVRNWVEWGLVSGQRHQLDLRQVRGCSMDEWRPLILAATSKQ